MPGRHGNMAYCQRMIGVQMGRCTIEQVLSGKIDLGKTVAVQGWVRTRRDSKAGMSFIELSDGSCQGTIQVVAPAHLGNYASDILRLTTGCAVRADGTLVASQGRGQAVELTAEHIDVVGWIDDPDSYPVPAKRHTFEYLREVAHLRPRTNSFAALTRVRHTLAQCVHRFMGDRGFYWVNTPIITGNDCEGAGELFRVSTLDLANPPRTEDGQIDFDRDFFGREAFLTVSGQLNVEAYCLALSKVYTFGPTFRAENSNTSRHLAEFWMVEPELAFADLHDISQLAEDLLKYLFQEILRERHQEMAFFDRHVARGTIERLEKVVGSAFERMDYDEAIHILESSNKAFEFPVRWGLDLQSEHERFLTEEHVGRPVIVANYPKDIKAFYMRLNDDGKTVAAFDVLAPGIGEIVGGSQREERLPVLDARMDDMGIATADLQWYRDLRRYGTVPHAGFGLGFERTLGYVTGMANVRDLIPFPRTPRNARF